MNSEYTVTIILIILMVAGPIIGMIVKATLDDRTRRSMKNEVDEKTQRATDIAYWKAVALSGDSSPVQVDVATRYLADCHGIFIEPESSQDHFHADCRCMSCHERRRNTLRLARRGRRRMRNRLSAQRDRAV